MTIYEINAAMLECIDPETGEVNAEQLEALNLMREQKIENAALWLKNLKSDVAELKAEKKAFEDRIKAKQSKIDGLTAYLMNALDGAKFETPRCAISYRKSESVNITDLSKIPADYLRFAPAEADKTAIKAAIKAGESIDGAEIVQKTSMQIK
jgi:phage shock protein A